MEIVGHRNRDRIHIRLFEQFAKIDVAAGNFEPLAGFTGPLGMVLGNRYRRRAGAGDEAMQVFQANSTRANHCTTKLVGHISWMSSSLFSVVCSVGESYSEMRAALQS